MLSSPCCSNPGGPEKLAAFLRGTPDARVFTHPIEHPSRSTGFCPCDGPFHKSLWFYLKAGLLQFLMKQPYNKPKIWYLRKLGVQIGENVYISVGAYIDPLFPELLCIEDNVMIGMEARIILHEFAIDEFRAGRITLRKGCLLGGYCLLRPGIEVGEYASVAPASVVIRDVPAYATAIGSPARNVLKDPPDQRAQTPDSANDVYQ